MNKTQIKNKIKQIEMMDRAQLEEFAATVHNAVGMKEMKREFEDELRYREVVEVRTKSNNCHNTDGGKTNFYDIDGCSDVDDLCEHWGLNFFEGNCLKAIVGIAKARCGAVRHDGTSAGRDANKLVHYAKRVMECVRNG